MPSSLINFANEKKVINDNDDNKSHKKYQKVKLKFAANDRKRLSALLEN
jgi:hypothetical protein